MDAPTRLLIAITFLTIYVVGIGGTTAAAIGIREAWRRRVRAAPSLGPGNGEVVLSAPSLPRMVRYLSLAGWVAFLPALALALIATRDYPWVAPVAVTVMVAINAFYFTAIQSMGDQLTLAADGFRLGSPGHERNVRWVHVSELMGAHMGAFKGMRMSEAGEWQDPKVVPNVIFFRLNRALVRPQKTLAQRISGLSYYDGLIRNAFGVTTEHLLQAMREWQRQALDAEAVPLRRPRPGEMPGRS